ncbi:MAG TPA: MerR family DNA-binding transcriptional regulator, partial [Glycomyces sp.]|nr:MerR family DNA-binding transcriptional regulator [Glycomyces sp.]
MLRAGQVAAAAGIGRETLRYYERRGLMAEPERTPGGHRVYPPDAVTRLLSIK